MTKVSVLIIALATVLRATPPSATCNQQTWVANNQVSSIVPAGNKVYICGGFTHVGPYTGGGVPLDSSTGAAWVAFPKINGIVMTACSDDNGGWFVGGIFTSIDGVARKNIAHISSSGNLDPAWNPNADTTVLSLVVSGTTVYAGGSFTTIGGWHRNFLAALDVTTGNALDWNPAPNGLVTALAVSGPTVYVGGYFTNLGGQDRHNIAALDATTGNATAWNPHANREVLSLAVSETTVYAAGSFDSIGSQRRNGIAALDATTGNVLTWNPNANGSYPGVYSLVVSGATVYVGGEFTSIGGLGRNNVAALDATTGNALAWNPNANNLVDALAVSGTAVYIGGEFTSIGGQVRNNVAALDAITGNLLPWNPNANSRVSTVAVSGTTVYVGGVFTSIGQGVGHSCFAQFDSSYQSPVVQPISASSSPTSTSLQIICSAFRSGVFVKFTYALPKSVNVSLKLYKMNGTLQSELVNQHQEAGNYSLSIQRGKLAAGAYLVVFRAGEYHHEKMVILTK